jgi:hypothetical protein
MALPEPECGLVISYSYLWRKEYQAGRIEGLKNRPCAVIFIVTNDDDSRTVTVAPITHAPPSNPSVAIEIPPKVKQYLGLDWDRSWIVLDDFNEFLWPGYDLRIIPGKNGRYDYGFIPPVLFKQISQKVLELDQKGLIVTPRD